MKKIIKDYVQLVVETIEAIPFDDPESTVADALLGQYAFAPERIRSRYKKIPPEPNTEYENALYKALNNHIFDSGHPLSPEHIKNIKDFIATGQYKKVFFNPPPGTPIFRGLAISIDRLRRILGVTAEEEILPQGKKEINYVMSDHKKGGYGVSWTTNRSIAKEFANNLFDNRRICKVIFQAAPGQEHKFLQLGDNGDPQTGLYYFVRNEGEYEVMAMDSIVASKIWWTILSPEEVIKKNLPDPSYHKGKL